jgi:hypothetical protein
MADEAFAGVCRFLEDIGKEKNRPVSLPEAIGVEDMNKKLLSSG